MTPAPPPLLRWLAALNDHGRLRMLRLLEAQELSVGELGSVLQAPQSTVSRHLKLLLEGGWLSRRAAGTASLYRMDPAALEDAQRRLWEVARAQLGPAPVLQEDDRRLAGVMADRRTDPRTFFGRLGGEWDGLRRDLFGSEFTAEALVHLIDPDWSVADLGCGSGPAAELLAPVVRRVVAVDREPAMLDAARQRLAGVANVEFLQGDLEALPLEDGSIDAAVVFLVLVFLEQPETAVREMARVLRPGGRALVVDMVPHDRASYRQTMGHRHLGFAETAVRAWADASGLALERYRTLRPDSSARGPGLFAAVLGTEAGKRA